MEGLDGGTATPRRHLVATVASLASAALLAVTLHLVAGVDSHVIAPAGPTTTHSQFPIPGAALTVPWSQFVASGKPTRLSLDGDTAVLVWTGHLKSAPNMGALAWIRASQYPARTPAVYLSATAGFPDAEGALHSKGFDGTRLTLRSGSGRTFFYDFARATFIAAPNLGP